jgi:hypothetical protein
MDLRDIGLVVCGLDSTGLEQGPVVGCCECGDEPSGSCATELVIFLYSQTVFTFWTTLVLTHFAPWLEASV